MAEPSCVTCRFFDLKATDPLANPDAQRGVICRRFPPKVVTGQVTGFQGATRPIAWCWWTDLGNVTEHDWCGEWQAKETTP